MQLHAQRLTHGTQVHRRCLVPRAFSSSTVGPQRAGGRSRQQCARHNRAAVVVRASAQTALEEVDPITGLIIPKTSASNPVAGRSVNVKGVTWAYRASDVDASKASADKPVVLLVHGLGSSSWCFRTSLSLLGADGYEAYAPDWPGHGDSSKTGVDFSEEGYVAGLQGFVDALGISDRPIALVVHGFVLSQFALLWALKNESKIARLLILNTPLALDSKLRPELAAYKAPLAFMRPKSFDGLMFNATGSAYMMEQRVADVYAKPYADPAASAALAAVMDKCDFNKLLKKVSDGYQTWRKPSILMFGGSDPFVKVADAFKFLEDKRTNMKMVTSPSKLGHSPCEDFPEAVHDVMLPWLQGKSDEWSTGQMMKLMKMTKKGAVEVY